MVNAGYRETQFTDTILPVPEMAPEREKSSNVLILLPAVSEAAQVDSGSSIQKNTNKN